MILFSPMKKEEYTSLLGFGLGASNIPSETWNLAALSSRCLFAYENKLQIDRLAADFDKKLLHAIKRSINQTLGNKRVSTYMKMDSPWEFYEALKNNKHNHLYVGSFHKGGLPGLVKARCYAWEKVSRALTEEEKAFILMHSADYQKDRKPIAKINPLKALR